MFFLLTWEEPIDPRAVKVETLSSEGYYLDRMSAAIGYNEKKRKKKSRSNQGRPIKKQAPFRGDKKAISRGGE